MIAFVSGVIAGLGAAGAAALVMRRGAAPAPYYLGTVEAAETYRARRGLAPGAPIPSRTYWRAVQANEIDNPPWIKTPEEMKQA